MKSKLSMLANMWTTPACNQMHVIRRQPWWPCTTLFVSSAPSCCNLLIQQKKTKEFQTWASSQWILWIVNSCIDIMHTACMGTLMHLFMQHTPIQYSSMSETVNHETHIAHYVVGTTLFCRYHNKKSTETTCRSTNKPVIHFKYMDSNISLYDKRFQAASQIN
jgi:hypothetical protein